MKSRLQRLLGNKKSRFSKSALTKISEGDESLPDTEVSSASSGILSHDDEDYALYYDDPYADVRDEMERLAEHDRARFATHTDANRQDQDGGHHDEEITVPWFSAYTVYMGYAMMIFWGHIHDFCAYLLGVGRYIRQQSGLPGDDLTKFAPLLKSWEHFYTRRLYTRVQDCFNRPIASNPGAHIDVLERVSADGQKSLQVLGSVDNLDTDEQRNDYRQGPYYTQTDGGAAARHCVNLGSYNYLGFADDWMATCGPDVKASLQDFGVSMASTRTEYGTTTKHRELEETVARFLGKEDAVVLNMGFNTNATTIPALVERGDLLISDELNHTSIVSGARASGAAIRIFKHNDPQHLEEILRQAIVKGKPRTRRPWNKIMVIVEGIYSMEGEYCDLKNIVRVCKKYGAYIYLDEAHSIGAMGPTGRGISEYCGVDTADIDIMMGTFTKSFGGMGGYIAASKEVIEFLREKCAGSIYHNSLSPVVCQQCLSAFKIIMGEDGTNVGKHKLQSLRDNSNYFRMKLREMGLLVMGHYDSPIMPVMLFHATKISAFSRECFKRGLAVVVVGFPAVPLLVSRARFCISAGHTREDLDRALAEIDEVADLVNLRYSKSVFG
mmetsp:Transcript_20047/g.47911  ORF Transcript_20047/g.47911 Transcript_20047/m.47911 type:complete len:610 (+) Transcript_20047:430-2259(+)